MIKRFANCFLAFSICAFAFCFECSPANAKAISLVSDQSGIIFILDDKGNVWAFDQPDSLEQPVRLPGLTNIVRIAPFLALRRDGKVFNWGVKSDSRWIVSEDGEPLGRQVTYTAPEIVPGLSHVSMIASMGQHFMALVNDDLAVDWGQPLNNNLITNEFPPAPQISEMTPRELIKSQQIISISVGARSETVLTKAGIAYGWGYLHFGDCEQAMSYDALQPKKLYINNSLEIYSGEDYLISLSVDGLVHYWGGCFRAQSLSGEASTSSIPKYLDNWTDDVSGVTTIVPSWYSSIEPMIYILKDNRIILTPTPYLDCNPTGCLGKSGNYTRNQLRTTFGTYSGAIDAAFAGTNGSWTLVILKSTGEIIADGRSVTIENN